MNVDKVIDIRDLGKNKGYRVNQDVIVSSMDATLSTNKGLILETKTLKPPMNVASKDETLSAYIMDIIGKTELWSQTYASEYNKTATPKYLNGGDIMDDITKTIIEKMDKDSREREERLRAEMKEREERIIKHLDDLFNSQQQLLDLKLTNMDTKLSNLAQNISHLRSEMNNITQRVDSVHGRVDNIKSFIIGAVITLLLGVVGIVYANWQVISSMIQISK